MKDWLFYRIPHSQKNYIDIYCRQVDKYLEIYITTFKKDRETILLHDQLVGNLDNLRLDQTLTEIPWTKISKSFKDIYFPHSDFDDYESRRRTCNENSLDFIKYKIANAINSSHDNKSYARYIKKNILGTWEALNLTLIFSANETFELIGKPEINTTLAGVVEKGFLFNKRNFITFIDKVATQCHCII
jgi:hypothetical protein